MLESRGSYTGAAELWTGGINDSEGTKHFDVMVELTSYVDVEVIQTFGQPPQRFDGPTSWNGRVVDGLTTADLINWIGKRFELRLPSGRNAIVALADSDGTLLGSWEPPFDVVPSGQ